MALRIFDYEISGKGIINAVQKEEREERKKNRDITERIYKTTLTRITKQIKDWQVATLTADSVTNPLNYSLIAIYRDIEIDAHLFALMQTIVLKVLANGFGIYDQGSDELNEEATAKFKKKWFRKFVVNTVNAEYYGFSLNQFSDIVNGVFSDTTLVPRDYVNQRKGGVQSSLSNSSDLAFYGDAPYKFWTIGVGDPYNLGLLHKAAPLVIKKKEVIAAWSEAAEIFGMPIRVGNTRISSPENRANMEDMLENLGTAAWGVFDTDDKITFVETSKTDFYKIYAEFISLVNSELSKLFLLQTGTTDEKAFVGAAEVHESILQNVIESYILLVEEVVNEKLIPLCVYHGILQPGQYYKAMNEQKLSTQDTLAALAVLLNYFDIDEAWIEQNLDIPVTKKQQQEPAGEGKIKFDPSAKGASVMNQMKEVYKAYFDKKKTCC